MRLIGIDSTLGNVTWRRKGNEVFDPVPAFGSAIDYNSFVLP
jgi:hypothetical protein